MLQIGGGDEGGTSAAARTDGASLAEADALVEKGIAYAGSNDFDAAIAAYTEAIELDPNNANAYYRRGNAYKGKGENDLAVADYTEALRLDPNNTYAQERLAKLRKPDAQEKPKKGRKTGTAVARTEAATQTEAATAQKAPKKSGIPRKKTTAQKTPEKKGIPGCVWGIVIPVCILGGGALGAFMAQALWLRILLGLAGAVVLGITSIVYAMLSDEAKNPTLAIVTDLCAVAGAALGALLGRALWQRAVFGLAGALALTLVGYIVGKLVLKRAAAKKDARKKKEEEAQWAQWAERWGRFSDEEKRECWQKTESDTQTAYWLRLSVADKSLLWQMLTPKQRWVYWSQMGDDDRKTYWSTFTPEQKTDFLTELIQADRTNTISQYLDLSDTLLQPDEKDTLWSMLNLEQKHACWAKMGDGDRKTYWATFTPEQKTDFLTELIQAGRTDFISQYLGLSDTLLQPDEKDKLWSMLDPERKYACWTKMNDEGKKAYFTTLSPEHKYAAWQKMGERNQKAYFPKLPFDARMDIVTRKADEDVKRETAAAKTAVAQQRKLTDVYNGALPGTLFENFNPGAGYGFLDSVESARQKYEYLRGIGEYYAVMCNAWIAFMKRRAAEYGRIRAQAVVYCQEITEISSRLSVKEREAFDTTALNKARQVKEIRFDGEMPEIAVSADYVFGSTLGISNMSRREKKQLEKSVTSFINTKGISGSTKLKVAGAALAVGAAVEIGAAVLNKIEQASEAKRQYKEAEAQLIPQIGDIAAKSLEAENVANRLGELIDSINKSIKVYTKIFSNVNDALYPAGDPSKSPDARAAREKSGKAPYFTMDEKQKVMELAQVAGYMMKIVDAGL
jgi:tetratricopeptide (TPR) repeat protein